MSENKKIATINGLVLSLDPKVDISIVHRYYDRAYQSLYANAFLKTLLLKMNKDYIPVLKFVRNEQ